jgi:hypothetical protein
MPAFAATLREEEKASSQGSCGLIVERLTKWKDDPADLRDEPESAALLMRDAAQEIERLQREVSVLRSLVYRERIVVVDGGVVD